MLHKCVTPLTWLKMSSQYTVDSLRSSTASICHRFATILSLRDFKYPYEIATIHLWQNLKCNKNSLVNHVVVNSREATTYASRRRPSAARDPTVHSQKILSHEVAKHLCNNAFQISYFRFQIFLLTSLLHFQ